MGTLRPGTTKIGYVDQTQYLTLTGDVTAQALDPRLAGGYLYQVGVKSTLDEAFTITITSASGFPLFSDSWTSAATGEDPKQPSGYYFIPKGQTPTITTSGIGSGSVLIEIVTTHD